MGERPSSSSGPTRLRSATKCFLFSINLVTFIFGLVLFFLGVVLQTRYARYFFASEDDAPVVGVGAADGGDEEGHSSPSSPSSSSPFYNLSAWCTAMGVVVCVVSFLGLYGSVRESHCALLTFSVALGLAIFLECSLAVSAFALAKEDRLKTTVEKGMRNSIIEYGVNEEVTKVWDILQTDFACCGVDFSGDWASTAWAGLHGDPPDRVPDSCCSRIRVRPSPFGGRPSPQQACVSPAAHQDGCLSALEASARKNAGALGAIAAFVALGQVVLVAAACYLIRQMDQPKHCRPCY